MRGGVDITDEVFAGVERKRKEHPLCAEEAISLLMQAQKSLQNNYRPWLYDCIYESIKKIDEIIEDLRAAK